MSTGRVYVGIVSYNSRADLPNCLAGLAAQTYPDVSIWVLDNASEDGSADWLGEHAPHVKLIRSPQNLGFGRGHNQILAACRLQPDDFYLALNPDVSLEPNYIAALVAGLGEFGADWGTGKLKLAESQSSAPERLYSLGHALRRDGYGINIGFGCVDDGNFDKPQEVFGAPAAAALYRAGMVVKLLAGQGAFFDADMFMYGEDTDLDWRARRLGLRCWSIPAASAAHRGSSPGAELRAEALTNRYLSVLKNACWLDLLTYNLPLILLHVAARLILSPKFGLKIALGLLRRAPKMLAKRARPFVKRQDMLAWFSWSAAQPSAQPSNFTARLKHFKAQRATRPTISEQKPKQL